MIDLKDLKFDGENTNLEAGIYDLKITDVLLLDNIVSKNSFSYQLGCKVEDGIYEGKIVNLYFNLIYNNNVNVPGIKNFATFFDALSEKKCSDLQKESLLKGNDTIGFFEELFQELKTLLSNKVVKIPLKLVPGKNNSFFYNIDLEYKEVLSIVGEFETEFEDDSDIPF